MKKMSLFLLVVITILSTSATTEAANWVYIGQGETIEGSRQSVYIDTTSISGGPGGPKEAWMRNVDTPPDCSSGYAQDTNKCAAYGIYYRRYFSDKTFCTLKATTYFTDGSNDGTGVYSCRQIKLEKGLTTEVEWKYLYR